jgi:hypothetical protein
MRALVASMIACAAFAASTARADDAWDAERRKEPYTSDGDTSVWSRWLAVDGHLGAGTPYGFAGVSIEATPVKWWTFGGGLGVSYSGLQLAVSSRVRYPWGHSAIAAGVGVSRGPYGAVSPICCDDFGWSQHWSAAYWLNVDVVSIEHRSSSGRELRFYFGFGSLLNPKDGECHSYGDANYKPPCENRGTLFPNSVMPYIGFAYGAAFPE